MGVILSALWGNWREKMRKQVKCYKKLVAMITGLFAIQVSVYDGGLGAVPRAARISPW